MRTSSRDHARASIKDALAAIPVPRRGRPSTYYHDSLLHEIPLEQCWPWAGAIDRTGYGHANIPGKARATSAHRAVWEILHGEVGADVEIDHLCHARNCALVDGRAHTERASIPTICPHLLGDRTGSAATRYRR